MRRERRWWPAAVVLLALLAVSLPASGTRAASDDGGSLTRHTTAADDSSPARDYLRYVPATLAPPPQRALVVFLHGCTQTADQVVPVGWNRLADSHGFVVVYPEQALFDSATAEGNDGRCWNWFEGGAWAEGEGEFATLARMTRDVATEFGVDAARVYVSGVSAGAITAAALASLHPQLYAAMGSLLGCGYPCGDATGVQTAQLMGDGARVVPGFFVSGTLDVVVNPAMAEAGVRQWVQAADLVDNGAPDGSVSPVPTVEHVGFGQQPAPGGGDPCVRNNNMPCPAGVIGVAEYPRTVARYADAGGRVVVESWMLHGLSHNHPGAPPEGSFSDPHGPDVTAATWDFFVRATATATGTEAATP